MSLNARQREELSRYEFDLYAELFRMNVKQLRTRANQQHISLEGLSSKGAIVQEMVGQLRARRLSDMKRRINER